MDLHVLEHDANPLTVWRKLEAALQILHTVRTELVPAIEKLVPIGEKLAAQFESFDKI
jgi:hypothetical protein